MLAMAALLDAGQATAQDITLDGVARSVSLVNAIYNCGRYYPVDTATLERVDRAFNEVGEKAVAREGKDWRAILRADRAAPAGSGRNRTAILVLFPASNPRQSTFLQMKDRAMANTTKLPKAALERAQYVVECLRTRFVREGWHENFDKEGAERTLRCILGQVEGKQYYQREFEAAIKWLLDHGQSIDWILRGDPGGMICQCAHHSSRGQQLEPRPEPRAEPGALEQLAPTARCEI
jgi:hypothetical protein